MLGLKLNHVSKGAPDITERSSAAQEYISLGIRVYAYMVISNT